MPPDNPTSVLDDPEFHQLPAAEKHKVLMATDGDYRGMQPSEQAKALDEIHYGQLGRDQSQFTGGTRNRLADAIDTGRGYAERGVTRFMQNFGLPTNPDEARHLVGGDPGQKPALMEMIEAGPRALPVVGPSMQASEDVRAGKYPEAAADIAAGVAGAAPFRGAGVKLADAIGTATRTPEGAVRAPIREGAGIAGGYAGHKAVPYYGAYAGYSAGKGLAEAILPDRPQETNITPFRQNVEGSNWTPEGDAPPKTPRTGVPRTDPFQGATSTSRSAQGPVQGPSPKPKMRAADVKRAGIKTGNLREDIESSKPSESQPPQPAGKEKLSPAMRRKVDEAQGRYDARRMAAIGAERDEDARTGRLSDDIDKELSRGQQGDRPSLSDAVSDASKTSEARPVSPKDQNLPKGKLTPESSGAQRAKEISPMDPQERADLEKQAGKKFTSDADAYDYRRKAAEWEGNRALAKGKVDTDVKQSTGLRDVQKKAGYGKTKKSLKKDIG